MKTETIRLLVSKGMSAEDILEIAESMDQRSTNAERQARFRANKKAKETNGVECPSVTRNVTRCADESPLDKKDPHTPKKIKPLSPPIVPPFALKFVEVWNECSSPDGLPKARELSPDRRAKLKRRVSDFSEDELLTAIRNLAASDFHCGRNDRGWRADIGWLLKSSENVTKALELGERAIRQNEPVDFLSHLSAKRANS